DPGRTIKREKKPELRRQRWQRKPRALREADQEQPDGGEGGEARRRIHRGEYTHLVRQRLPDRGDRRVLHPEDIPIQRRDVLIDGVDTKQRQDERKGGSRRLDRLFSLCADQ